MAVIVVNDNPTLSIELVAFMENGAKVRSDETLYRIPAPLVKSGEDNIQRLALIMVTAPGGPSRIVQSPFGELPEAGPLVMGPIDYDENGSVIFSGTSKIEGQVQVFAGDMPVGERTVGANGRWFFIAAEILPLGTYDVTAELITEDAEPHKVTVPFRRITQSALGSASQDDLAVSFRSNVWQISRTLNAGGRQYTAIFSPQKTAIPDETQKTSP